jgi:hypothetical protein
MSQPAGDHEEIIGFSASELTGEFRKLNLPYFIPNHALVKSADNKSAYLPDILILNRSNLASEPLWKKYSTVTQGASIPLTSWLMANIKSANFEGAIALSRQLFPNLN